MPEGPYCGHERMFHCVCYTLFHPVGTLSERSNKMTPVGSTSLTKLPPWYNELTIREGKSMI